MAEQDEVRPGGAGRIGAATVSRIGYGAMRVVDRDASAEHRKRAVALVRRAVELGVDHVDTAEFYGDGMVNRMLAEALRPFPEVLVATKLGADVDASAPIGLVAAQRPEQLRASLEDNLRSLEVERIPLVYLRRLDLPPGISAAGDQVVAVEDQLAELVRLREEGKLGAIGLSGVSLDTFERALPAGIVAVQNAYSLVDREHEAILRRCVEEGVAWVPFFPLGSAFPGRPKVVENPVVVRVAAAHGVSAQQVGLAWLLAHAPDVLLIPGTADVAHLEQNVAVGDVHLTAEEVEALDAAA